MSCSNCHNDAGWKEISTICRNVKSLMGSSKQASNIIENTATIGVRSSSIHTHRENNATSLRIICDLLPPVLVTSSQCVDMGSVPLMGSVSKEKTQICRTLTSLNKSGTEPHTE